MRQDCYFLYVIPVNELPDNDAKLKLDKRPNMRRMHYVTIWAKDYEFVNVDRIIKNNEIKKIYEVKIS